MRMWSLVSTVVFVSTYIHLVRSTPGHTAYVQVSETSLVASRGCKLPREISANVSFGENSIPLKLEMNTDIFINAPVFRESSSKNGGVEKEELIDIPDSAVYQDLSHGAAMTVTCTKRSDTDTSLRLHGCLSHNDKEYTIMKSKRIRRETSLERSAEEYDMTEEAHPAMTNDYRIPEPTEDPHLSVKENHDFTPVESASSSRHKRQTSQYYIDVLALIDYGIYKRWYDSSTQSSDSMKKQDALQNIRKYFAYVMNGVNLRYKSISGLNSVLNIRLVGYYVAESSEMGPWTETYAISGSVRQEVDADKVLVYLRDWIPRRLTTLPEHDHAMLFTGYDLYTISDLTGRKSTATSGLAYIRTLCRKDGRSISLVEDFGGFQCVDTAAHELGHSIGAKHDGDGNSCRATDRFIMSGGTYKSTPQNIQNPWFFSSCSVDYFRSYLSTLSMASSGIRCLTGPLEQRNVPDVGSTMPGQLYTPNQQCKMIHGDASRLCQGPEFGNSSAVCTNMFCLDPDSTGTCFQHEAARGTSCGNKKWCIDGICQYSSQAPSAVDDCVFGDQAGLSFDGKTCADFTAGENSAYCYQAVVRGRCCGSCRKYYTGVPSCPYGNKVRGCDARFCDYVDPDGTRYDSNCCGTCGGYTTASPPTTKPTTTSTPITRTTTTPVVTTPKTTVTTTRPTDTCTGDNLDVTFNGMRCSVYVNLDPRVCYTDTTLKHCCHSCRQVQTGIEGCQYGDRFQGCSAGACDYVFDDGTTYKFYCCDTCNRTGQTSTTSTTTQTSTTSTTTTTTIPTTTTTTPTTTPSTTTTTPTTTTTTSPTTTTTPTTVTLDPCEEDGMIYGVRCSSYLRVYGKGRCYSPTVSKACCRACDSFADNSRPGCLYGDRHSTCYAFLCDLSFEDGTPYSQLCCETCLNRDSSTSPSTPFTSTSTQSTVYTSTKSTTSTPTQSSISTTISRTTSTTSTSVSIGTTPTANTPRSMSISTTPSVSTTTATCVDTNNDCVALLRSQGVYKCYEPSIVLSCCLSCTKYRDDSLKGCEYGDRSPDVCKRLSRPLTTSCSGREDTCCSTCKDVVVAAAAVSTVSYLSALLSAVVTVYTTVYL